MIDFYGTTWGSRRRSAHCQALLLKSSSLDAKAIYKNHVLCDKHKCWTIRFIAAKITLNCRLLLSFSPWDPPPETNEAIDIKIHEFLKLLRNATTTQLKHTLLEEWKFIKTFISIIRDPNFWYYLAESCKIHSPPPHPQKKSSNISKIHHQNFLLKHFYSVLMSEVSATS